MLGYLYDQGYIKLHMIKSENQAATLLPTNSIT